MSGIFARMGYNITMSRKKESRPSHMSRAEEEVVKQFGFNLPGHRDKNKQRAVRNPQVHQLTQEMIERVRRDLGIEKDSSQ